MNNLFKEGILTGLSSSPKEIDDKYFYDEQGNKLFEKVMNLKKYYLTNCEHEIFSSKKAKLLSIFSKDTEEFHIIEFGVGNGYKTKVLLSYFLKQKANFKYFPVDISTYILKNLETDLRHTFPKLQIRAVNNDYFKGLKELNNHKNIKKIIFFIGNSFGNFSEKESVKFLNKISNYLTKKDLLFIGFDLKKDPSVIYDAYDKTFEPFCMRIFKKMNDELGGNFNTSKFKYYFTYNPENGQGNFYLISKEKQTAELKKLKLHIHFKALETIYVGISQKYDIDYINKLAKKTGFEIKYTFYDKKKYFIDSILSLK
jgi:dimethylhistidine N-methyltransferase